MTTITDIYFVPMKRENTFIGFISFSIYGLAVKGVAVHELEEKPGKFWLVYPEYSLNDKNGEFIRTIRSVYPTDKSTSQLIEKAITEYLKVNWNSKTRVVKRQTGALRNAKSILKENPYAKSISEVEKAAIAAGAR